MFTLKPLPAPSRTRCADVIEQLSTLRTEKKRLEKEEAELVAVLDAFVEFHHVDIIDGKQHKAILTVQWQDRLNTAAIRAAFGKQLAAFTNSIKVRKWSIQPYNEAKKEQAA